MVSASSRSEKVCLITGATSGVGKVTALAIAKTGATTVLVARNEKRGKQTVEEIISKTGNKKIALLIADLSSQASIHQLADQFLLEYPILNLLVNNAGVGMKKRTLSVDGIEMTFAINYLAYFLLTKLLLARLKESAPSHIINVASEAHRSIVLDFENLQGEKSFSGFKAYSITKMCNVLFTYELARRLEGTGVTANVVHPGYLNTAIFRETPSWFRFIVRLTAGRPEKGADAVMHVWDVAETQKVRGKYFNGRKETPSSQHSYDRDSAEKLWRISEDLLVPSS